MEKPYCKVDGIKYQLEFVNDVLRFPTTKLGCDDLNKLHTYYCNDKIDLKVLWDEYTQTGSSFCLVESYFTKWGTNNHTVTNGKGDFKVIELYSGDEDIDSYYDEENVCGEDKLHYILENYDNVDQAEAIEMLEDVLEEFKNR